MNGRRRVTRTLLIGASVALLIVGWYLFAPRQLGGRASYVTTTGTSMEPELHEGDVVVVRTFSEYHVGDVVAYHNPDIGQVVLHRIVELDGDRFVLKGDNNTWLDAYRPAEEEILGGMAALVPGMGAPLRAVRTPLGMSAVVSVAALGVFGGRKRARHAGAGNASAEREDSPASRSRADRGHGAPRRPNRVGGNALPVLAGVAAVSLVLGVVLFALSPTTNEERDVVYEHSGTFSYEGRVPQDGIPVYGRSRIETGDPVYLELTRQIQVGFDYAFDTPAIAELSGTARLVAEVSDVNGWRRVVELAPPVSFEGGTIALTGELDLDALRAMTGELEHLTGVERDHYTVTVRPEITLEGTLAGLSLTERFAPELRFFLDPNQLQLEPEGSAPPGEEVADPVHPAAGGLLKTEVSEPRAFSAFGVELGLGPLRAAVAVAFALALAGLLAIQIGRARSARRGEAAFIESRYGQWLVPVQVGAGAPTGRTVEVETFDSLVRLATHYGHVVLHEEREGSHAYSVEENGVTYRYLVANGVRPS